MQTISKTKICLLVLLFVLSFIRIAGAENWDNQDYLMDGVYYLINQKDLDMAEKQFHKAILSSSFDSLSGETDEMDRDRQIVAEAFYFLGKINIEKASSQLNITESAKRNISHAKYYLKKADEYGITYDRLHPRLLDDLDRKYPDIKASVPKSSSGKIKVSIEMNGNPHKMQSIMIDKNANVTKFSLPMEKEFSLESDAIYKVEPYTQGAFRTTYKALIITLVGLSIWLIRS